MAKGGLAYPIHRTPEELCALASLRLSNVFGAPVVITPDTAGASLYRLAQYTGERTLDFNLAMCALYGCALGPIKAT